MGDFSKEQWEKIKKDEKKWTDSPLKRALDENGEWKTSFKTNSGDTVKRLYTPLDVEKNGGYLDSLGFPGGKARTCKSRSGLKIGCLLG